MYARNGKGKGSSADSNSFTDGFLGSMDDEIEQEEESGLPLIEDELLDSGTYQNVILEEASIDEPLPGMEKSYVSREEEWDFATADFHGSYEDKYKSSSYISPESSSERKAKYAFEENVTESRSDSEPIFEDYETPEDDTLSVLASLSGVIGGSKDDVDTDEAFDEVEDQDEDFDDVESILAGITGVNEVKNPDDNELGNGLKTNFRVNEEDEELLQGFNVDQIISLAIDNKASDIHINPNQRVRYRVNGSIQPVHSFDPIPGEITRRIQQKITTNVADDIFLKNWELDTSYTVKDGPHRGRRVRVSVTKSFEEVVMVMRVISQNIPLPHELEIEDELLEWSELPNGLVIVNGPTGTGKSTTLASLIQSIQMRLAGVILTVEKPVEYMYKDQGKAIVYQREVGRDTLSFSAALDSGMRMDPDVILIGETRNAVEMDALLYAADTGHLALSTTHANSASEAVNRIKRMFSGDERRQAMESLSTVSRGFAAQVLCKTVDGNGRFAVREILSVDREISDLIMQGDNRGVRKVQEDRGITLDHGLVKAVQQGRCTIEEARSKSPNPRYFDALMGEVPRMM